MGMELTQKHLYRLRVLRTMRVNRVLGKDEKDTLKAEAVAAVFDVSRKYLAIYHSASRGQLCFFMQKPVQGFFFFPPNSIDILEHLGDEHEAAKRLQGSERAAAGSSSTGKVSSAGAPTHSSSTRAVSSAGNRAGSSGSAAESSSAGSTRDVRNRRAECSEGPVGRAPSSIGKPSGNALHSTGGSSCSASAPDRKD